MGDLPDTTAPLAGGANGSPSDPQQVTNVPDAASALLDRARAAPAGRAGATLTPGAGTPLKQTLLALTAGQSLADHESPAAATLQVLIGSVQLTGGDQPVELCAGDHAAIPPQRHGLLALDDAVVLLTVAGA